MNDNSIRINSYLQNEMGPEERTDFEKELVANPALLQEMQIQRSIISAAFDAGLKGEFAKTLKRKKTAGRVVRYGLMMAAALAALLVFNFRGSIFSNNKIQGGIAVLKDNLSPFINPPLQNINVPFTEFSFDAEKGDTLFIPSGSVVYFPPSALVDAAGNLVKGKVDIRYREFSDPLDQFVSGIPMNYDSAGVKYNFESSGMCEINAYQNNKAVFVNPRAKPEISLASKNKSADHNLYYLDTAARRWNCLGKDHISIVKDLAKTDVQSRPGVADSSSNEYIPVAKPVKPLKALEDHQSFRLQIDPNAYEELAAYDNLKFEVVDERAYHASDADEHWDNVQLDHGTTGGIYTITFTNAARKVTYKVRPVLEGADYDAALKVFDEKQKQYEQALDQRLVKDKKLSDSVALINKKMTEKMNAEKAENDRVNALIMERNKQMKALWERRKAEMEKQMKEEARQMKESGAKQQEWFAQLAAKAKRDREIMDRAQRDAAKFMVNGSLSNEIIRTFSINNFGIFNCDHPQYPDREIPLYAGYLDSLGKSISLSSIAVVYKGVNGITSFPDPLQIRVIPGGENMIWGIQDSSFFYYTYKDFAAADIQHDTRVFNFKMRKAKQKISSYEEIRALVGNL